MGVIRPHYAGLSEADADALVEAIAEETGEPLQIVNYNIKGRQYSVVGKIAAIGVLKERLEARTAPGGKAPYIEVPGIDVPFHSRVLEGGVARFRETLDSRFPDVIPVETLVGRYIPNLVPRVFNLSHEYVQEVFDYTGSEPLQGLLKDWEEASKDSNRVGRTLLIELLAWQFASPVRWIETQDLLLSRKEAGGMGIEEVLEVGVGYQPTLTNMAKYTLSLLGSAAGDIQVRNIEADGEDVFFRQGDPAPVVEEEPVETAAPAEAAPVAEVAVAAVAAPPIAASAGPVADQPFGVEEALKAMLAIQSRLTPGQVDLGETIDEVFDGVFGRRNQVLMDIGAEFNLGTIDGAHEQPLHQLIEEIEKRSPGYQKMGAYLSASVDEGLKSVLGPAGMSRKDVVSYLSGTYGLGDGLTQSALLSLFLETRTGDSARGVPSAPRREARVQSQQFME